ncbi:class I SAM-dependent DNA methyltransferase [Paenibacillus shenyangensis]|uniref:class I SAM-dependent DNA methyltransferase n=1 Tax=Paenibacillus sp. A9 TaxID=1284352 RepID=UPI000368A492|nr:class I SAM-dependent methyltransferase [Paenibacillus sp. A9]
MNSTYYNSEEYDQPQLYDEENGSYTEDIAFLRQLAEQVQGPIIDLACGTGRATIPLARAGYPMIGIDIHQGMLDQAKAKSAVLLKNHHHSIQWLKQDCTSFQLDQRSDFIFTVGNSFQHFLTNEEQDGLLHSVNHHLNPGGWFVFNTRFPSAEELLQPETEEYWRSYTDTITGQQVDVYTISQYDPLEQIQHYQNIRRFRETIDHSADERTTHIYLRYVYPQEMKRLLRSHGFEVVNCYEDWQKTPLCPTSEHMIYVCKKR